MSSTFISKSQFSHNAVPLSDMRVRAAVQHVIRDRRAGSVEYVEAFSEKCNLEYVSRQMAEPGVARAVRDFFQSRQLAKIVDELVGTRTVRIESPLLSKWQVYTAIESAVSDRYAAYAIANIVMPAFIESGFVPNGLKITTRTEYPFKPVTMEDIQAELLQKDLEATLNGVRSSVSVKSGATYSVKLLGEMFAEAHYPIAAAIRNSMDYRLVLWDMVRAVRACIDPAHDTLKGSIPHELVDSDPIQQLSRNLTFVEAAMALNGSITPACEMWKLDKWVPVVYAMIRNSERFAMVSSTEYLGSFGLHIINDMYETPRLGVLYEAAVPEPVSMIVSAVQDALLPEAWNIDPPTEKFDAKFTAIYGELPNRLSTMSMARIMVDSLTPYVDIGADDAPYLEGLSIIRIPQTGLFSALSEESGDHASMMSARDAAIIARTLAAFRSRAIFYQPSENGFELVYEVAVHNRRYEPTSGSSDGVVAYLTDPYDVLLAAGPWEHTMVLSTRPQLIDRRAFNGRILDFNVDELQKLDKRFSFSFDVLGTPMRGSFRMSELDSLRGVDDLRVVRPFYNAAVVTAFADGMSTLLSLLERAQEDKQFTIPSSITKQRLAGTVMKMAQSIAPTFRKEVHSIMVAKTVSEMPSAEARTMAARLKQDSYRAFASVYALSVFMTQMGLDASFINTLVSDEEFVRFIVSFGMNPEATC